MGKPGNKSRSGPSRAPARKRGESAHDRHDRRSSDHAGDEDPAAGMEGAEQATEHERQGNLDQSFVGDDEWGHEDDEPVTDNPQTCCSNCQTIFEVSVELLSSSDTRVRCGECLSIFDALTNLRDAEIEDDDILVDADGNVIESQGPPAASKRHEQDIHSEGSTYHEVSSLPSAGAAALAGLANDTGSLDVTYSDFDLFSEEAELPEVAYFDQTRDTPEFDFDDVDENDETFSDTLFAQDVTVDARSENPNPADAHDLQNIALTSDVDYITDDAPSEPLIFNYRERETRTSSNDSSAGDPVPSAGKEEKRTFTGVDRDLYGDGDQSIRVPDHKGGSWLFRGTLLVLAMSIAGGLYVYRERDSLYTHKYLRPVLEAACSVLNCSLPDPSDLSAIKVVKRAVFSHPTINNALIINLGFINEASFNQRYPVLEIRLTDRIGRLVVKNNFFPVDYLETWQEGDKLDAGKRLDISLTVEDPGNTATSFELDFR